MVWFVILGTLAAFGAVCVLWILLGLLLPCCDGSTFICLCRAEEAPIMRRRCRLLRELGFMKKPVRIITAPLDAEERLLGELDELDAAGNGDPTGDHQCGGISEL